MKKVVIAVLVLCFLFSITSGCNSSKNLKPSIPGGTSSAARRFPAEFEKQQAIWVMWPSATYEVGDRPVSTAMVDIIKNLAKHEPVNVMIAADAEKQTIRAKLQATGYTGANVRYRLISHSSIWARDVGPIFVADGNKGLSVVNFGFNNYSRDGNAEYVRNEGQVDVRTAAALKLPVINSALISEGGAIESNGRGTLMLTESVALTRNPGMTRDQIANEYKRVLGIKKVIWLKKGLAEDDGITSGHINEIARFANPSTILLAQVLPVDRDTNPTARESYQRMEENYRILKQSTDQDGQPFTIIRIPMPPTLYADTDASGKIPVRSYLNYAVANGAVLIQTYWKPGRSDQLKTVEQDVEKTLARVFSGRQIIGIDAENINKWGGGIHCVTQHQPAI